MWRGTGGWETRRKGDGRCMGGGRRGDGKWEKRENYATLHNILQSKKCREAGAKKYRVGMGSGRFKPPCPFSPMGYGRIKKQRFLSHTRTEFVVPTATRYSNFL